MSLNKDTDAAVVKQKSMASVIEPNSVAGLQVWSAILGLPKSCLARETRLGRLRFCKRAGRRWILGRWLLEWLEDGEVRKRVAAQAARNDAA